MAAFAALVISENERAPCVLVCVSIGRLVCLSVLARGVKKQSEGRSELTWRSQLANGGFRCLM